MSGQRPSPVSLPADVSRIVLTGFMGAGKTTVGALLAEHLQWRLADTDRQVEELAGMTVAEVFAQQGEPAFRQMEAAAIREAASAEHVVVALGGGALENPSTREFLAALPHCRIVFLDAPLEALIARCAAHDGGPERPVLRDLVRLTERWKARLPWYRQAHLTLDTSQIPPHAVADHLLDRLRRELPAEKREVPA